MNNKNPMLLITCLILQLIISIHCNINDQDPRVNSNLRRLLVRRQACPNPNMCLSQWGYCGTTIAYCGQGCRAGPCIGVTTTTARTTTTTKPIATTTRATTKTTTTTTLPRTTTSTIRTTSAYQPSPCSDPNACLSQWGYCGYTADYCGQGCRAGPCIGVTTTTIRATTSGSNGEYVITDQNFACIFNNLDASTRGQRLDGLQRSGYKPANADEAAVFLGHVYHETDGLRTLTEYCAPGCGPNYVQSWCNVQAVPGKSYYGRGWFQLSYPCNYHGAGQALGLDLLNNPDLVSQQQDVAVKTAVWYFQANNMVDPARRGDFAATTRIINGAQECNGGPGFPSQQTRVTTYRRVRQCFGLGEPTINPTC